MTTPKHLTAKEIRQSFKDFFASKGHRIVPSAPMVIKDDPTLMFTNAGMNQFKDIILGQAASKHRRVADSQKCLRVSGKHNDLEEVGLNTYHHTMFEMLGNWSFGDYFKAEAIDMAWEYLVDVLGLNPEHLYATVFEGSDAEGLARDDEAAGIWLKHLPADHIINGNKHDNFWEMGDTGPAALLGDTHRPPSRRRARADARPRAGEQGPSAGDRDLEPCVHAVQPQGRRQPRTAARQGNRHRHGLRAPVHGPARQDVELRHRRLHAAHRQNSLALGQRIRQRQARRRGHARHRRPCAHHSLLDSRQPAAEQRQGRLCNPPHPSPRRALRLHLPRPKAGIHVPPGRHAHREHGRGIPRASRPTATL